ncbi:MAG: hypothetical protein Fur0046_18240 [Cyanobacteria bacterium J069]
MALAYAGGLEMHQAMNPVFYEAGKNKGNKKSSEKGDRTHSNSVKTVKTPRTHVF